jgi:cellulose synthase (UDP-forming)
LQGDVDTSQAKLKHSINRVLILLATIFSIRYFYWRAHSTMVPVAKWFFYAFLIAELLSFLETLLFYFSAWKYTCHPSQPPLPDRKVDVFIATYNEPVSLLRDTVVCAMSMTYPHKTYLLDDGNRADVRALARELCCEYIARTDRTHAKAGNLNNALKNTQGEFIVTLDADHVPMPDFIEKLIGFFADPAVAIVQTSQDFYNQDSFQHVSRRHDAHVWQQQELFFSVIQPGKDAYNAAFYCGSPAMCRRADIEEIGGFATETITEDMHTGLRLQKRQKKVLYYNKTLAWGLAPQTFAGFVTQWRRWGHGAFQVLRCENPLFGKGLTAAQRICYFSSFYFYWMSYQKVVYILTPIFCLLTGIFPLLTEPGTFARYFVPYLGLNLLATATLQGGLIPFLLSERFNIVKLSALLGSLKGLFRCNSQFAVTPKSKASGARWSQMWLQLVLLAGILTGLVVGFWRIHEAASRFQLWALTVNLCWAIFFVFLTAPIIRKALARSEYRRAYRFPTQLDAPLMVAFVTPAGEHKNLRTHAKSLNGFGLAFTWDTAIAVGVKIEIYLRLTGHTIRAGGIVVRSREIQFAGKKHFENGIRFERIGPKDRDAIAKYLFWEIAPRHGRRMQLTYESQNQQPATVLPEILHSEPTHTAIAITDFAMRGEPVGPTGSK